MMKFYSPARSCTQTLLHAIPAHRPCRREKRPCLGAFAPRRRGTHPAKYRPKIPSFRGFFILPQRHLPERDFPVQVNPTQINKILRYYRILSVKSRKVGFFPLWFCCDAYNLTPESTTYDCTKSACCGIIYLCQQHKSAGIKNAAAVAQRNHSGIVFAFYTLTFTTIFFTAQGPAAVWRRGAWASSGGTMAKSPAFKIMQPLSAGSS